MSSNNALLKNLFSSLKNLFSRGWALLTTVLEKKFFFSNILFPLLILVLYYLSFEFLITPGIEIPDGVTPVYVNRSWKYFSYIAAGSTVIFFIILRFGRKKKSSIKDPNKKISWGDLLLLLLPLTPVIQYVINNDEILSTSESFLVIGFFVLFSGIYTLLIPAIFRFIGSTRILIAVGLAFVFSITYMALLSQNQSWYEWGSLVIQWMYLGGIFLVTWLLYDLNEKKILRIVIAVFFLTNTTTHLIKEQPWAKEISQSVEDNKLLSLVGDKRPIITPSIYLLVYDAYVPNETMLGYGIDNSLQEEYLEEMGFKLYPHTYSVGDISVLSMSRVLNSSLDFYGSERRAVSGDGIVQNTLRTYGYQTYGLFPTSYFFDENPPTYDFSTPDYKTSPDVLFLRAILMGEFRFDVGFNKLSTAEFFETKQKVFEEITADPVFIYMHNVYYPGHSQNSGACLPNEIDLFEIRLGNANREMRADINRIMENDPEGIIIVAGDHGPHLTKNCVRLEVDYDVSEISRLDIQDRFGTFLAIKWPTQDFEDYDDITVLQDLFPAVFSYMFSDESILESKIEPVTLSPIVNVQNGIIYGGINDGEPLYISDK